MTGGSRYDANSLDVNTTSWVMFCGSEGVDMSAVGIGKWIAPRKGKPDNFRKRSNECIWMTERGCTPTCHMSKIFRVQIHSFYMYLYGVYVFVWGTSIAYSRQITLHSRVL